MSSKYERRKIVTGDTAFEATQRANELYGEGNYELLGVEPIVEHKYFGFVKHTLYNLHLELKEDYNKDNQLNNETVNKSAENTYMPTLKNNSINYSDQKEIIPPFEPIIEEKHDSDALTNAGLTYTNQGHHAMRRVDDLRSLQEGSNQPHSQKTELDTQEEMESADQLLEYIQNLKLTRGHSTQIDLETPTNKPRYSEEIIDQKTSSDKEISVPQYDELYKQMTEFMKKMTAQMNKVNRLVSKKLKEDSNHALPECPYGLKAVKESLVSMDTPSDIADEIIKALANEIPSDEQNNAVRAMKAYANWCSNKINFAGNIDFKTIAGPKIIALLGPTGVGKTTTIAKIAAPYRFCPLEKRKKIVFFTLDIFRLGATEQLAHYAEIFDIVLEVIYEPSELDQKIAEHFDKDLIIIDTAGRCPKNTEDLENLNEYLSRLPNVSRYLVISATTKYVDMQDTIKRFQHIGFDNLIFTKLDETCSVGPMLAVMIKSKIPLAYMTNGQGVPNDILIANNDSFYKNVIGNTLTII